MPSPLAFAEDNEGMFFCKAPAWSTESEYRLVLIDQSSAPATVDVRQALTHVVLGESFPDDRWDEIAAALSDYPHVEFSQARYHNRRLFCEPAERPRIHGTASKGRPWPAPRMSGSLEQRLQALRVAGTHSLENAELGQRAALEPLVQVAQGMEIVATELTQAGGRRLR